MKIQRTSLSSQAKKCGYSIITANNKFYIQKDGKPVKWQTGFRDVRAAINFIEGHEYVTATVDAISWSDDDLDYLLDTYHFYNKADNVWISKINDVVLTLVVDKKNRTISLNIDEDGLLTVKEFATFDDVIETVDRYFNGDDIFATVSILSNEQVKQVITARSTRDIAKNLVRVKSSNIWAYGMDIKDRHDKTGTLVIQFKGRNGGPTGGIYVYYDVPVKLWRQFISSPSKGHFFWQNIRNNFYYSKLDGDRRGKLKNAINR